MALFEFHPPGNPLDYYAAMPFRPTLKRRTAEGRVCYFCGTKPDIEHDSPVPCCEPADEMNDILRRKAVRSIWNVVARQVKE
jgi:hypothetical protein